MQKITWLAVAVLVAGMSVMGGCKRRAMRGAATQPRTTAPSAEGMRNEELEKLKAQLEEVPLLRDGVNFKDPNTGDLWERFPNGMMFRETLLTLEPTPKLGQTVSVAYTGTVYGQTKPFDRATAANPLKFPLGDKTKIKGFNMGVATMKKGSKRVIFIPPEFGYGAVGNPTGNIPPNAALVFELELLDITGEPVTLGGTFTMPAPLGPPMPQ